jgi:tRNA (guanine-N7-)-methyltransferase
MSRRKLQKFKENETRANIIQPGKDLFGSIKGNWSKLFFKNDQPIILELGCGRGEYTIGMARLNQEINYVGVDIKGDRIWKGGKIAEAERLSNVGFLRTQIQSLENFFMEGEVREIWLTFPDPRPKKSDLKRRLTHPRFMEIYRRLVAPVGTIHLKTDNAILFNYSLEVVQELEGVQATVYSRDLYQSDLLTPELAIKTHYEVLFAEQGYKIKYLRFQLATP